LTRFFRKDILRPLVDHVLHYPSPVNLNYNWGFGSLAIFYLILQIISGILLTIYFTPTGSSAFESVQFIMREANYGWLIRYMHTTGSSVFFAVVYAHIGRGLYYGSFFYPRILVWYTGLVILLLMMGAAFFGYILPWGQMSFWAATVITNLFATIPYLGDDITLILWGDYSVGPTTLKRFFTFHFIIPFIILGVVLLHIIKLHRVGSNNPLGRDHTDYLPLYPYFFIKDALFVYLSLILTGFFVSWEPNLFIHPDNNIAANALVTPEHIVPEWYFLPFYAILRTIPSKFLGFLCMMLSIVIMFFLPFLGSSQRYKAVRYHYLHKFFFFILIADFVVLGWLGGCSIEYPYLLLSRFCTFYYFFYFFVILPAFSYFMARIHDTANWLYPHRTWFPDQESCPDHGMWEWTCIVEYATFCEYYDEFPVEYFTEKDDDDSFLFRSPREYQLAVDEVLGDGEDCFYLGELEDFKISGIACSIAYISHRIHNMYLDLTDRKPSKALLSFIKQSTTFPLTQELAATEDSIELLAHYYNELY